MVVGTGVAAAVPVSGMAGAAAASAQRSKYIFAVALAHNRIDISADMISDMFDVRPGTANQLMAKLVRNGVVDTPNASGIARLAKPLQRITSEVVEYNPAGGYVVKGRLDDLTAKARDAAKRILDSDPLEEQPTETDDTATDQTSDQPITEPRGESCTTLT